MSGRKAKAARREARNAPKPLHLHETDFYQAVWRQEEALGSDEGAEIDKAVFQAWEALAAAFMTDKEQQKRKDLENARDSYLSRDDFDGAAMVIAELRELNGKAEERARVNQSPLYDDLLAADDQISQFQKAKDEVHNQYVRQVKHALQENSCQISKTVASDAKAIRLLNDLLAATPFPTTSRDISATARVLSVGE